ncbi:ABC transporter permease [Hymenobacter lutimineralis]|uniref:ABC transporter permease n=1 Tax=Hymenobacter lutimineralis TaxID=2606448 RepID=A0A5D6V3D0_9BACT|nr:MULTISPECIES: ABC transporter permease [Hymenobacter]QIX60920.1 ABC transporter permease [Hymenobacter sp. BT18]TYZ09558.1 ABC transporter permease [Hymenobacter lutimineralis]
MARRILYGVLRPLFWLWLLVSVIFLLTRLAAPTPTEQLGHPTTASVASPEKLRAAQWALRHRLGLDLPLFYYSVQPHPRYGSWIPSAQWHGSGNQYHQWLRQLAAGSLGNSYRDGRPVTTVLLDTVPNTLLLTLPAAIGTIGFSLWAGLCLTGRRWWQRWVLGLCVGLDAVPLFLVATTLVLVLANPDALNLFPAYGAPEALFETPGLWTRATHYMYYFFLPISSLLVVTVPGFILQLTAALNREVTMQYTITARAKGLSSEQVLRQHLLRNALLPFITLLTDLLPALLAGAVVVEVIFALPGMGRLLAEAAATRDHPILLGGVLLIAMARLLSYWLADGLYGWADPRLRSTSTPAHA